MAGPLCQPSLSDINYILARWQQRWSDQREAAWRLQNGAEAAQAPAAGAALPAVRAAEDTKQFGFPLEKSVELQLLRRSRVGVHPG